MDYSDFSIERKGPMHTCCDNCEQLCECEDCKFLREPGIEHVLDIESVNSHIVNPNEAAKSTIRYTLEEYFKSENSLICEPLPELVTGLCATLAKEIAEDYISFVDLSTLQKDFNVRENYAENIVAIIKHVYDHHKA
jgi:hypothetical protein